MSLRCLVGREVEPGNADRSEVGEVEGRPLAPRIRLIVDKHSTCGAPLHVWMYTCSCHRTNLALAILFLQCRVWGRELVVQGYASGSEHEGVVGRQWAVVV